MAFYISKLDGFFLESYDENVASYTIYADRAMQFRTRQDAQRVVTFLNKAYGRQLTFVTI